MVNNEDGASIRWSSMVPVFLQSAERRVSERSQLNITRCGVFVLNSHGGLAGRDLFLWRSCLIKHHEVFDEEKRNCIGGYGGLPVGSVLARFLQVEHVLEPITCKTEKF